MQHPAPVATGRPRSAPWAVAGIALGVGVGPVVGGACFAICAVQARRASRHPGVAPTVVATDALVGHGPDSDGVPALRVTWVGDSLAAGIGADQVDDTPALVVARLLQRPVELRVLAVPGSKAGDVLRDQAPKLGGDDLVVLSVGANDVASRTSRRRYARELDAILMAAAPTPTVVMSMPDITMADRIGQPLRWLAGLRADYFDAARRRVVDRHPHAVSVDVATMPADLSRAAGRELLCADRFHPGPQVYRIWADRIAAAAHHLLHPVEGAAAAVDPVTGVVPAPVLTR